jgi:hypothetical protein
MLPFDASLGGGNTFRGSGATIVIYTVALLASRGALIFDGVFILALKPFAYFGSGNRKSCRRKMGVSRPPVFSAVPTKQKRRRAPYTPHCK